MNNKLKQNYCIPQLSVTELLKKDVILSSNIEEYSGVVIDDGDWPSSLIDSVVEDIW